MTLGNGPRDGTEAMLVVLPLLIPTGFFAIVIQDTLFKAGYSLLSIVAFIIVFPVLPLAISVVLDYLDNGYWMWESMDGDPQ